MRLGTELITNGEFSTNTAWTCQTGFNIRNNALTFTPQSSDAIICYQELGTLLEAGKRYYLQWSITSATMNESSLVRPYLGANKEILLTGKRAAGNYSEIISIGSEQLPANQTNIFGFVGTGIIGDECRIDDVSLKEILLYATGLEEAIYQKMANDDDIAETFGSRIYPQIAPQSAPLPYIVWHLLQITRDYHLSGQSDLAQARVQFTIYSSNYWSMRSLSELVRNCWSGYSGTIDQVDIKSAFLVGEGDLNEGPNPIEMMRIYSRAVDIRITYQENV